MPYFHQASMVILKTLLSRKDTLSAEWVSQDGDGASYAYFCLDFLNEYSYASMYYILFSTDNCLVLYVLALVAVLQVSNYIINKHGNVNLACMIIRRRSTVVRITYI